MLINRLSDTTSICAGPCLDLLGCLLHSQESLCASQLATPAFISTVCSAITRTNSSEDVLLGATLTLGNVFNISDGAFTDDARTLRDRAAVAVCRSGAVATLVDLISIPRFK